jgi:Zn-dependent M28 family amino/carboxypeptidase
MPSLPPNSVRSAARLAAPICAALLCCACGSAIRPPPPSTDADEDVFREHVRVLASDEFAGRKPATIGEEKTVAYLVAQFRRLKLKPGNGASYLQSVPMVELTPGSDARLTISGASGTQVLTYGRDMVVWTKRVQPTAGLSHSELVFAGYGIVAPEYGWDDYAGIDVRGKTVMLLVNDPGHADIEGGLFKGRTMTYYGRWVYKLEEAARHGAGGVLLIHDKDAAGYDWPVVQSGWTGPQLDLVAADGNAGRAAIEAWVSNAAARRIFAGAGVDYAAMTAAAAKRGFRAVPLGQTVDAEVHNDIRRFSSSNVVALLPGRRNASEYIVYSAHWDHLGRVSSPQGDTIYHGAVDNASGVAGLLTLAQSFVRTLPPPDRSIVFVAFTGEEDGLLGSRYYVDNPLFPLDDTMADINMDALHIGGPTRDVTVFGFGQSDLEGVLRDVAALQGRELHADPNPELGEYYRSDNLSFARGGVPALYAVGGVDDSARGPVWGQAQLDDYREHRYHQPGDVYTPEWDVRGTMDDLNLYYRIGMRLTQLRRFPNWYRNSEFRNPQGRGRDAGARGN